ncbi:MULTISPECIES: sensor histidine kinase [Streptomyces]|uniref:Sensor histidine kinase n=2 Tax=Streptomyces rimosus subsp. rimosus TaxID=132474 RepID=L8EI26_STRR1|nr:MULTISPECIES: sensor histidine kinase [Streptomyces]KOG79061.1 histidine kinase [Kitasatospora aureofaciens]MYT44299.1 sensor histidine kinase [Streptomyces sp. SID5471]KEF04344.1 histidine kinase [Streptomyces rimosus]KEF17680.1 histidine kinase [Streptomyces rimosus]KOT40934.1 histidine kinase [Streptomyces rimosus subsp. rimosus]
MRDRETDCNPVLMGAPPRNRKQLLVKSFWIVIWFFYLAGPVGNLVEGDMSPAHEVLGWSGLLTFVVLYFALVFRRMAHRPAPDRVARTVVACITALAIVMSLVLGPNWLVLFTFVGVAVGVTEPLRVSRWTIPALTALLLLIGSRYPDVRAYLFGYAIPCLLAGFSMTGVQYLIRTTQELRAAREEVARLAANEERLRLARDLHDLLGHSLSLITLKSELAGRMLPGAAEAAAQQVADIERVSRQALVDVREAVTGYRRPRLAVELAGVRAALRTAAIRADIDPALEREHRGLTAEGEGALAWALREAVTNVVRHSGADRCELLLTEEWEADERRYLCLSVIDDGAGPPRGGGHDGNGLSGLRERLALADGRLETGTARRGGGFALRAYVPLGTPPLTGTAAHGTDHSPATDPTPSGA